MREEAVQTEPVPAPVEVESKDPCLQEIEALKSEPQLPGAPSFERHRAEILARARSVPLLFLTEPQAQADASPRVLQMRASLLAAEDPAVAIQEVLRKTRSDYETRRAVFLSDQYLFADKPLLALRLSQVLRLDHLFNDEALIIERGIESISVTRSDGRYFLPAPPTGPEGRAHNPQLASLLLLDRVRVATEPEAPKRHVDLGPLYKELGFSSLKVEAMTNGHLAVRFATYEAASSAVLTVEDGTATLKCEAPNPTNSHELGEARALALEDQALIDPVLKAAHEMIDRGLPFDEPKTEEGQQDGLLRMHFRQAYSHYGHEYEFNGDSYYVFDGYGRPRVPQVCIDFITDAFDWGTGGHWPSRGEKREYRRGALNFASLGIENPRSIENLAEFATETPEWFQVRWLDKDTQVKFREREKFFAALLAEADEYRLGDVVFIYGLRDDGKFHYHSFLVDEKDPLTGIPTVLVANAGPPQARSWEGEMQNAPLRKVVARMRVRREILRRAKEQASHLPGVPLAAPPRPDPLEKAGDAPG